VANEDHAQRMLLMAALIRAFRRDSEELAQRLRDGTITLAIWLVLMRKLVKRLHISAAGIAGDVNAEMVGARVQEQYEYLDGFAATIQAGEEGKPSVEAIIAQAALYGGAAYATLWQIVQEQEKAEGATEVIWLLRPAEHCVDCVELADRGWMPIEELRGQVPKDGQTRCLTNCQCDLEFR